LEPGFEYIGRGLLIGGGTVECVSEGTQVDECGLAGRAKFEMALHILCFGWTQLTIEQWVQLEQSIQATVPAHMARG
jgi:hypothetical protein